MQKKLYYLDESEKNRILNLHEDRTKKQYELSEQVSKKSDWSSLGQQYDDQIKQVLGLSKGTPLTDVDINIIYNKLKQMGKIK